MSLNNAQLCNTKTEAVTLWSLLLSHYPLHARWCLQTSKDAAVSRSSNPSISHPVSLFSAAHWKSLVLYLEWKDDV